MLTTGTSSLPVIIRCCCSIVKATASPPNCGPATSTVLGGWEELLLPEIERQQAQGKEVVFRGDAAFAKPELYEALEERDVKYAIRLPANDNLQRNIAQLLTDRWDGRATSRWSGTRVFSIRQRVGRWSLGADCYTKGLGWLETARPRATARRESIRFRVISFRHN